MTEKRVAVAMSGGVDSSTAAALLKQASYEVFGIHMQLWSDPALKAKLEENISILKRTCRILDIPFHILNLEKEFQSCVIDYFYQEYGLGHTPNPCVFCNRRIKFGRLLEKVQEMGADYLATGHYARIEQAPEGYRLLKASDQSKDQSYFLYTLGQKDLPHLLFPIGNLHKTEVRKLAAKSGLPTSTRPKSQDICFIPNGDSHAFIARGIPPQPGDIVDTEGKVLSRHQGLAHYTIGQRHGLGIAARKPLYVLKLDVASNRLIVGSREQLLRSTLTAHKLSWIAGEAPEDLTSITAKIRYKSPEVSVTLYLNNDTARVDFHQPQSAITPGQAIVFYRGEAVLGGGIIKE
jgi:tRNA-specific 2-thiouridylase